MKRDLNKAVSNYKAKYERTNSTESVFYISDIVQIKEMSETRRASETLLNAIYNALMAGFMIGYRKGQKDSRKKLKR